MKPPTPQELNMAICEWLGWKQCDPIAVKSNDLFHKKGKGFELRKFLPSHTHGPEALGNLHESEKKLPRSEYEHYLNTLGEEVYQQDKFADSRSASARQRIVALVRVIRPELFSR